MPSWGWCSVFCTGCLDMDWAGSPISPSGCSAVSGLHIITWTAGSGESITIRDYVKLCTFKRHGHVQLSVHRPMMGPAIAAFRMEAHLCGKLPYLFRLHYLFQSPFPLPTSPCVMEPSC